MTPDPRVLPAILAALRRRQAVAVVTAVAGAGRWHTAPGRHLVVLADAAQAPVGDLDLGPLAEAVAADAREALRLREDRQAGYTAGDSSLTVFIEVQVQPLHLIIAGAGHIAVPLAAIAQLCDFSVTVLDDRPQFANVQRFPTADRVIAGPFREELRRLRGDQDAFDAHTFLVLVTRGHQHDVDCLLEVLDDPVAYIGMIGSQRRIRAVFDLLEREQHVPPEKFDRIHAPVGLDIGAQTPAEIAVCIMAEMINVLHGGPALSLSDAVRRDRQERRARAAGQVRA